MPKLLDLRMQNGSRHFGSVPASRLWYEVQNHLTLLSGATQTDFVGLDFVEGWLDFQFAGQRFSMNYECEEYWFYVDNPLAQKQPCKLF